MAPFIKGDLVTLVYENGSEVPFPRSFVMVHDQTGSHLPRCDIFLLPRRDGGRFHVPNDPATAKAMEEYYGKPVTWPLRGFDRVTGPWKPVARVRQIRYRRRMPPGYPRDHEGFYHPYSRLVDLAEGRGGYRLQLGDGCFYNWRGIVRP